MNKPLRRIAIFCGVLILALLVRTNWIQYVDADELSTHKLNKRVDIERYSIKRGDIIVGDTAITGSKETDDTFYKYKRTWKNGPMWAPVTGYASQVFGSSQIENLEDGILTGNDDRLFFSRTIDMITGEKKAGGNVVTTLNGAAQKAAFEGLGNKKGAVAAIDPETGAILALASTPSYDPAEFAGRSDKDGEAWNRLKDDPEKPMLNRALRETYAPGSTFKVVTAAAALEHGLYDDVDAKTKTPSPWTMPGTRTELPNHGTADCKNAPLREAMRVSCNTVFGKIGSDLGKDKMIETAEKFGFNEEQFTPVRADASVFPTELNPSQTALSSIGQFNTRATPLQMAMVTAAIANDGTLMQPYMVSELKAPNLDTVKKTSPKTLSEPLSKPNAQKLQETLETTVNEGTGSNAKIDGVTVGGKTGTAETGENNEGTPFAWFISYAKTDSGSPVAVAVVVEDSDAEDVTGGGLAAPIAKDVMKAVIDSKG
ncbi:penicillin-binding transpeptidase domain-containing protein [Streptomyces sp. E11-3]|uniref:peptidoglycan D,D-transpeptidase FtsI family protein n=1 Tax=Streptomyces sp. E11-3 TaxID=3110112 RepID=UPI00397FAE6B